MSQKHATDELEAQHASQPTGPRTAASTGLVAVGIMLMLSGLATILGFQIAIFARITASGQVATIGEWGGTALIFLGGAMMALTIWKFLIPPSNLIEGAGPEPTDGGDD